MSFNPTLKKINQAEILLIKKIFFYFQSTTKKEKTCEVNLSLKNIRFFFQSLCKLIPSDVEIANKFVPNIAAQEGDG